MPTLAICQLFNPHLHGFSSNTHETSKNSEADVVGGHFIALHTCDDDDETPYEFLNFWTQSSTYDEQDSEKDAINEMRSLLMYDNADNSNIANIRELRTLPKVDIVDTVELNTGHLVAIKKTLWLSIFQRMLKKRYSSLAKQQRKRVKYY